MKELVLKIRTRSEDTAGLIMKDLSKYDCSYNLVKEENSNQYTFLYQNLPYTRLGDISSRSNSQYRKDMKYYNGVSNILSSYGCNSNQIGFKYAIECIRLMNTYGLDNYSMVEDVYPVVGKWYDTTPESIEHNVRNLINTAWKRWSNGELIRCQMIDFDKKPTNRKFLKHIAKITAYLIAESY